MMWHALWLMLAMVTAGAGQEAGEPAVCSHEWFARMQRRSKCDFTPIWNDEPAGFVIQISAPEPTQNHWVELRFLGAQINDNIQLTPQRLREAYEGGLIKRQTLANGDWWYRLEVFVTSMVLCPSINVLPIVATVTTTTIDLFLQLSGQAASNGTVQRYIRVEGANSSGAVIPSCGYHPTGGLKDGMSVFFYCNGNDATQAAGFGVAEITDVTARSIGAGGEIGDQELLSDKVKVGIGISALLAQGASFNPFFEVYLDWNLPQDGRRRHGRRQHGKLQDRGRRSSEMLGSMKVTFEQDEFGVFHATKATVTEKPVPLPPPGLEPSPSPSPGTYPPSETSPPHANQEQAQWDDPSPPEMPSWFHWPGMIGNIASWLAHTVTIYFVLEQRREVRSLRERLVESMKYSCRQQRPAEDDTNV